VRGFLIAFLICLTGTVHASDDEAYLAQLFKSARDQRLSEQPAWRLLLHFHHDLLGRYRSEIDDPRYFLSPRGRRDPSAELDATLRAFFEVPSISTDVQHPQCRYPARYAWLKEQLQFDSRMKERPCPRFAAWRDQMDAESLTLIFASYYLNNPASMYGHTFFRLNSKRHGDHERLLDYAVNFSAYPDSDNPVLYVLEGLSGGYPGRFSTLPYYMKVQEYNNLESRDLWEYALTLEPGAMDRLVRHLWEMGQASMAYYFLNKNCSYQLLPVLEVAQPSLRLVHSFWFKAIPADTLRSVIHQPGILAGVRLRPSHVSKMLSARAQLSREDVRSAERLAKQADDAAVGRLDSLAKDRQAKILDSAYDLFRYRVGFSRNQSKDIQEQERKLLMARHRLGFNESKESSVSERPASPDQGHPTGRAGISFGASKRSHFEELSLRAALHDQEDDPVGYVRGSQLEMLHLRVRHDNDRRATYVQELTLIDILSLSSWDRWTRKPSWKVRTGLSAAGDVKQDPEDSLMYGLQVGPGISLRTHVLRGEHWYALAEADTQFGGVFENNFRAGAGTESGVIVEAAPGWHVHFKAAYFRYPWGNEGEAVRLRLIQACPLGKSMQFRVTLERQNRYKEMLFSLLRYF